MVCEQNSFFTEDLHKTGIDCSANYCACLFSITVSIIKIELVLKHFNIIDIFIKIWLYNLCKPFYVHTESDQKIC